MPTLKPSMKGILHWRGKRDLEEGAEQTDDLFDGLLHLTELASSKQSLSTSGAISFRPLQPGDRDHVQQLHEEWFPVSYKDEFYDELVKQRMVNSGERLITCAAIYSSAERAKEDDNDIADNDETAKIACEQVPREMKQAPLIGTSRNESSGSRISLPATGINMEDQIVSCIVGTFLDISKIGEKTSRTLIFNPEQHTRVFYIMTLGTVTEFRYCRLGSTLVKKCIQLVNQDPRCGAMYLHVITFNKAAIRFYENLGFHRVKEIKDYYRIDGKKYSCYLYARYFHGNRGDWDVYYHLSRVVASVLDRFKAPFSMVLPKQPNR